MTEWLQAVGAFAEVAGISVEPFVVILARISGLFLLIPGVGMRIIPVRLKVIIALAISLLLLPTIGPIIPEETSALAMVASEVMVGAFFGFTIRLFIFVLSIAGATIAQSLSLSQIFGAGVSEEANTTVSTMLTMTGTVLFLTVGFHIDALSILVTSFRELPPGLGFSPELVSEIASSAVNMSGYAMRLALILSIPFLLMNFVFNLFLGVMNKAMPQLMVTFVGLPGITFCGIVLLFMAVHSLFDRWLEKFGRHMIGFLP